MLYDILIIDDDFGEKSDAYDWDNNANKLLLEFIQDNLRVTWTTGEIADLKRLSAAQLSCIRYIFLDLHLSGIKLDDGYKTINSKLIGILQKINEYIKSEQVVCFINSKYINFDQYGFDGINDLAQKLKNYRYMQKYTMKVIENKNQLTDGQKSELIKSLVQIYARFWIINEAIGIEKIFDEKLPVSDILRDVITFDNKYKKLRDKFELNANVKKQIQLLQQIRNKFAHTDDGLSNIEDTAMRKTFWKIVDNEDKSDPVKFNGIVSLMKYIESIDSLKDCVQNSQTNQ